MALDYGKYNSSGMLLKIGYAARCKMFARFMKLANPTATDVVLDVGVTPNNLPLGNNFFEKMYPYTQNITMCTVEDASNLEIEFPGAHFVRNISGEALPFADKQFDIVFCSAVIEHVGNRQQQQIFLSELIRVGKKLFLTTPNKNFPVELHTCLPFVHWLPQKMHQKILSALGMKFYANTNNLNLLSTQQLRRFIPPPEVEVYYHRLFGFASNIILFYQSAK